MKPTKNWMVHHHTHGDIIVSGANRLEASVEAANGWNVSWVLISAECMVKPMSGRCGAVGHE